VPRHTVIPSRVLIVISTIVVALGLLLASSVQATSDLSSIAPPVGSAADGLRPTTGDYKVRSGDTLWDIADDHTPDGRDVWVTIEEIKHLNDLDSSVIHPGQNLAIPLASGP